MAVCPLATGELQYLSNDNTSFISNSNAQMLEENINEEYDHYYDDGVLTKTHVYNIETRYVS